MIVLERYSFVIGIKFYSKMGLERVQNKTKIKMCAKKLF